MRKHIIFVMAALALLMTSCKNDDISISREVRFDLNPFTVIEDFAKHQVADGDLEAFAEGDKLRVQLFVYNENGELVKSDIQFLPGYRSTMTSSFELGVGNYTVVATSDVVNMGGGGESFEYWEFKGVNRLSELRIVDNLYMGRDDKILGVSYEKITVVPGQNSFSIDILPAGALVVIHHLGIHQFHEAVSYELDMKKGPDYYKLAGDSLLPVIKESDNYDWRLNNLEVGDYVANNIYSYKFVMPLGETDFVWVMVFEDDNYRILEGTHTIVNLQKGKTYNCVFSIPDQACEFYAFDDSKSSNVVGDGIRERATSRGTDWTFRNSSIISTHTY